MPKHTAKKKAKKLTSQQQAAMKKHSVAHSAKHMKMMRDLMLNKGMSFNQAHKKATAEVGK